MSINKVTLSWNDFESSASNTIRRLWLDQDFSDVTLVTEDERQFTAHKVVLITGSQLFRNLFTAAAHPSPLLFLPGVRSEQLKLLLEFLYIGECQLPECQLPEHDLKEFLAVAAKLKISGLVEDIDNIEEQQRSGSHEDKTGSRHEGNPKDVPLVEEPEFIVDNENRIADERKVSSSPQENATKGQVSESEEPKHDTEISAAKTNKNTEFCKLCKETFANKICLIDHMKALHAETRHFCNLCERSYAQESNLVMHIETKHEGKRYDCNDCDFQSTRKSVLDIHIRFHHKGIGFDCFKCGKKYAHFNGLKIHNIKHHSMK